MSKSIIYYIQDATTTHLFRFYENGTALYLPLQGNALEQKEKVIEDFNENTFHVNPGNFHTDGNKISIDIELNNGNFFIYNGDILSNGDLRLIIYVVNSKKSGQLLLKPFDTSMIFDWKNSKYNIHNPQLLDLRLSTFKQLQHTLGEANVFYIDSEGIGYHEVFFATLNDFLFAARQELPNALVNMDGRPAIIFGNNTYNLQVDDHIRYISDMQILKDLNAILEAQGMPKRFFYFDDNNDNDMNCSYFYCDKDLGLQLIEFLSAPPFYSYLDFTNRNENRIIHMQYVDSIIEKKAEYFKRMLPDIDQ